MATTTSKTLKAVIQVLEKERYLNQAILTIPYPSPPPALAPSSIRIKSSVIALTSNNFTYAKLGFLVGWWDAHPLPSSTPAPYNDASKYGRISAWGWAEVLDSTYADVPAGSFVWGYQAIGTLPQDLTVKDNGVPGQVEVTSEHRKKLMAIYNRYLVAKGADAESLRKEIDAKGSGVAYDAIVRVMFETSYLLNRYVLGPSATAPSGSAAEIWTPETARVQGATIVTFAPASKVSLSFAHDVRHGRSAGDQPRRLVGVASDASTAYASATGLYDSVSSTNESPVDVLTKLGVGKDEKIILIDFGGRGGIATTWHKALEGTYTNYILMGVGSEIKEEAQADVLAGMKSSEVKPIMVNADEMRRRAMKLDGESQYFESLARAWEPLRNEGFKGLKVRWGSDMEALGQGWLELGAGKVKSDEGLAYSL